MTWARFRSLFGCGIKVIPAAAPTAKPVAVAATEPVAVAAAEPVIALPFINSVLHPVEDGETNILNLGLELESVIDHPDVQSLINDAGKLNQPFGLYLINHGTDSPLFRFKDLIMNRNYSIGVITINHFAYNLLPIPANHPSDVIPWVLLDIPTGAHKIVLSWKD